MDIDGLHEKGTFRKRIPALSVGPNLSIGPDPLPGQKGLGRHQARDEYKKKECKESLVWHRES